MGKYTGWTHRVNGVYIKVIMTLSFVITFLLVITAGTAWSLDRSSKPNGFYNYQPSISSSPYSPPSVNSCLSLLKEGHTAALAETEIAQNDLPAQITVSDDKVAAMIIAVALGNHFALAPVRSPENPDQDTTDPERPSPRTVIAHKIENGNRHALVVSAYRDCVKKTALKNQILAQKDF